MKLFLFHGIRWMICVSALFAYSCNTQAGEEENKANLSDSIFQEVMAGHDAAMPKMMKLERLQKEAKSALDSIEKLPAAKQTALAAHKATLDSVLKSLTHADLLMSQWMGAFKYDSLKNNEPERVKYLQSELEKVNIMKDAVLESIALADSVLAK